MLYTDLKIINKVMVLLILINISLYASIVSVSPKSLVAVSPQNILITVNFDQVVDPAKVIPGYSLLVMGNWAGVLKGNLSFSNGNTTLSFAVTSKVSAGETISINLSNDISAANGGLRFWEFRTSSRKVSNFNLSLVSNINVYRNSGEMGRLRTYGSFNGDLNQDGWHDLIVVNEDISDARVYMGLQIYKFESEN